LCGCLVGSEEGLHHENEVGTSRDKEEVAVCASVDVGDGAVDKGFCSGPEFVFADFGTVESPGGCCHGHVFVDFDGDGGHDAKSTASAASECPE
jgi:hypothetical protein